MLREWELGVIGADSRFYGVNIGSMRDDFINIIFNIKPFNRVKVFNISWNEINRVRDSIESNINTFNITDKMEFTKSFNKEIHFINGTIIKRKGIHARTREKFENSCKNKQYQNENNISFRGINRISNFKNFITNINKNNNNGFPLSSIILKYKGVL